MNSNNYKIISNFLELKVWEKIVGKLEVKLSKCSTT